MRPRLKPWAVKIPDNDHTQTNAPGKRRMSKTKMKYDCTRHTDKRDFNMYSAGDSKLCV